MRSFVKLGRERRLFTPVIALVLAIVSLGTQPTQTVAASFEAPFSPGEKWYVCQGYQTGTHTGAYALDLTRSSICGKDSSTGALATSPGAGVVQWRWSDGICIDLDGLGAFKIGHITPEVSIGQRVTLGQRVGLVRGPEAANNYIAHQHIQVYTRDSCPEPPCSGCDVPDDVPFAAAYGTKFPCGPDMPAGQNHYGKLIERCSGGGDDVLAFYDYGSGAARIHAWTSTGSAFSYRGADGWWRVDSGYTLSNVADRFVTGDFDGDGDADAATFYAYSSGAARIHVWLSTGSSLSYRGADGWWRVDRGYALAEVGGRFVSGDFNGDGRDDVATFYSYGGGSRIHVWLSTGTSFSYAGANGWWKIDSGYSMSGIGDRFVSGDFNADGRDDIATFYAYGGGARIHVWLSTGTSFNYRGADGWWRVDSGYSLAQVADRFVAGDFDRDGDDDVATFYDYGSGAARIHVWLSTRSAFSYRGPDGWWRTDSGYSLSRVGDRFVRGDFDRDGDNDVAVFYDYGSSAARIHVWLSSGSGFSYRGADGWWRTDSGYTLSRVANRFVGGAVGN